MVIQNDQDLTIAISRDDYLSNSDRIILDEVTNTEHQLRECRICFESTHTNNNPLIHPCQCNGNSRYIHRQCLNTWRLQHAPNSSPRQRCRECLTNYNITRCQYPKINSYTLGYFRYLKNHSLFIVFSSVIISSFIGQAICNSSVIKSALTLPYQIQPEGTCMIPPDLLVMLFHLMVEIKYLSIIKNQDIESPRYLSYCLLIKNILSLPLIYFIPNIMLTIWYIVTFGIYHTYIIPKVPQLGELSETIENYSPDK